MRRFRNAGYQLLEIETCYPATRGKELDESRTCEREIGSLIRQMRGFRFWGAGYITLDRRVDAYTLEQQLREAFPEQQITGAIAPHDCEDCYALRAMLGSSTWSSVPPEFVRANDDALPLLTHEAYRAALPAWLLEGIRQPKDAVADMLLVNLRQQRQTDGFTPLQASTIIDIARYITANNFWGPVDPVNVDALAAIKAVWGRLAV